MDIKMDSEMIGAKLAIGRLAVESGETAQAERLFCQTLKEAEDISGKNSGLAGQVLIELFDLYDKQGREKEAKLLWDRVRKILIMKLLFSDNMNYRLASPGSTTPKLSAGF